MQTPAQAAPPRLPIVDAARGAALAAMAAYHATWDLGYLQLTPENAALSPAGRVAAHLIAGGFLLLVGVGLVLMNGAGLRPRPGHTGVGLLPRLPGQVSGCPENDEYDRISGDARHGHRTARGARTEVSLRRCDPGVSGSARTTRS